MNKQTLEAITKHGAALLAAFPNATEKDPVALCKKLRRIETAVSKWTLQACNGPEVSGDKLDAECDKALLRTRELLGTHRNMQSVQWAGQPNPCPILINRDPRGFALKLESKWTLAFNASQYNCSTYADNRPTIPTDWGGYGLLAPDLNQ